MDLIELARVVATVLHLHCTSPELQTVETLPWPAAYVRTADGRNVIVLRKGTAEMTTANKIAIHELIHCGLWESGEAAGGIHPRPLDQREEMQVQALTDIVMERYYGVEVR